MDCIHVTDHEMSVILPDDAHEYHERNEHHFRKRKRDNGLQYTKP
jgi:hypothetical protein